MTVHAEILKWSEGNARPMWQRDALRRLVVSGKLNEEDLAALVALCKKEFLSPPPPELAGLNGEPLEAKHLQRTGSATDAVSLLSISGIQNVNALAPDQEVSFAPSGLTVIYGDNGSGKSGYGRLLKQVCRARGRGKTDKLLPDVRKHDSDDVAQAAVFRYRSGATEEAWTWSGKSEGNDSLGRIGVFDRHCGSVYVEAKNVVAFRPLGLDLFDHLVKACEKVGGLLEKEAAEVRKRCQTFDDLKDGTTAVGKAIEDLSEKSDVDALRRLGTISEEEQQRLELLRVEVAAAKADSPTVRINRLKPRIQRVKTVLDHTVLLAEKLSKDSLKALKDLGMKKDTAKAAAKLAAERGFDNCPLDGIGSETWKALWEAARKFSQVIYPEEAFPHVGDEALCLLCGRPVDETVCSRFQSFEDFVRDETAKTAKKAVSAWDEAGSVIKNLSVIPATWEETLGELKVDNEVVAEGVQKFVASASLRKVAIEKALETGAWEVIPELEESPEEAIRELGKALNAQLTKLREEEKEGPSKAAEKELAELEARRLLATRLEEVLAEVERRKAIAALDACRKKGTKTTAISTKSSQLTKTFVTKGMKDAFTEEIKKLGMTRCGVVLNDAGATKGKAFHQVGLDGLVYEKAEIGEVLSEGEHRAIGLASFFAEIGSSPCRSGIIFDDPVSSLDHLRRENVAKRLCEEGKKRQVIVFTHDVVFLLMLSDSSKALGVEYRCLSLDRGSQGTGVCQGGPPWTGMKVKDRIKALNRSLDLARKILKENGKSTYEALATDIYSRLRASWERAVEEVLFGGVVERFRRSVQTQNRLSRIAGDVLLEDVAKIDAAITKCSKLTSAHDDAAAIQAAIPEPDEVQQDIAELKDWASQVEKRRKKK